MLSYNVQSEWEDTHGEHSTGNRQVSFKTLPTKSMPVGNHKIYLHTPYAVL